MTIKNSRPTAPHLQIYKLPLTGLISITHRLTGVAWTAGLALVLYLLYALGQGETNYHLVQQWLNGWFGQTVYWGFIFALFFHFCHGVRHLIWDVGKSFEPGNLFRYAVLELIAAVSLTLLAWITN